MKIRQQEGGCMKKFIENIIIIMVLTVVILFSYAVMEKKISGKSSSEFINFLFNTQEKSSDNKNTDKTSIEDSIDKKENNQILWIIRQSGLVIWNLTVIVNQ